MATQDGVLEDHYRTTDMALATYLKLCGHSPQGVFWESGQCYWIFRVAGNLEDCVDDFFDGGAKVEPREYNRIFSQTKREFYDCRDAVGR